MINIDTLRNKLMTRLNDGQDQEHDSKLFRELIDTVEKNPKFYAEFLRLYTASLTKKGCEDMFKDFNNYRG